MVAGSRGVEDDLLAECLVEFLLTDAADLVRDAHQFAEVVGPTRAHLATRAEMLPLGVGENRPEIEGLPE